MREGVKQPLWSPPRIWEGRTVFILGGGPSLTMSPLHLLKNERVIAVNDAFLRQEAAPDVAYFGDCKWWDWNKTEFKKFSGLKITTCQRLYHIKIIKTFKRGKPLGIETTRGYIAWNNCSGLSAINIAYHFGAKKIVLVGFDMGPMNKDDKEVFHWHNRHKAPPVAGAYNSRYLPTIPAIMSDAKNLGIEIVNASAHTYISPLVIRRERLEDCI